MLALAKALVAEVRFGAGGTPADLVIVVDDLELHNLDQPKAVCASFRAAVEVAIGTLELSSATERRLRGRLRETGAFHLMAPMVEAYFFGEKAALVRAGCASSVTPLLCHPDVERFESNDPGWLPICVEENLKKAGLGMPWWHAERHPKHYLEFLIDQNTDDDPEYDDYSEVLGGVAAFGALDWPQVPDGTKSVLFARSMFEDISDLFGVTNPLPGTTSPLTYPTRRVNRSTLLLRNM